MGRGKVKIPLDYVITQLKKRDMTPTTPTTPKCEECVPGGIHWWSIGRDGKERIAHTSPEKEESLSSFFQKPGEEKRETMLKVARDATNDQREQIGLPPLEPTYIDQAVKEFRSLPVVLFLSRFLTLSQQKEFKLETEQFLREKLEEAEKQAFGELYDENLEEAKEIGRTQRTQEIVEMIKGMKEEAKKYPMRDGQTREMIHYNEAYDDALDDLLSRIQDISQDKTAKTA